MDLALNNLQRLICHKTQQTKPQQQWLTNYKTKQNQSKNNSNLFISEITYIICVRTNDWFLIVTVSYIGILELI